MSLTNERSLKDIPMHSVNWLAGFAWYAGPWFQTKEKKAELVIKVTPTNNITYDRKIESDIAMQYSSLDFYDKSPMFNWFITLSS